MVDLAAYIINQRDFSRQTFGEGMRTEGICRHIEKELVEIRAKPDDLMEWIDVITLALDGAWRAGHAPVEIEEALCRKLEINKARKWPPPGPQDQPTEHDRSAERVE